MADLKVTKMVINVDLQCSKCYRKIKKVLCSFPQIRNQMYDEKQNTVTITVVCCSPEKIKEKIACKAGDTVECIKIIPDKPQIIPSKPPPPDSTPIPPLLLPALVPVVWGFLQPPPLGVCCCCHEGGPCNHGRGPMCYDGCGRPANECSSGHRGYYVSRCEENEWSCSVM